ncbi:hypothetical protein C5F50_08435 [Nitrosopumilus ureiphilus]|uniref:Type IV pilin n=2 Tax=Nitrosopumilus ureiphilus TaxID=1470067 RepID=A0A7D5M4L1_9ARCH|nr:hypothetical protein C5F50_08435 [Nitrosopumilus ureiphilus]
MGLSEKELQENIQKMSPGDKLICNKLTLHLTSIKEFHQETMYVLKLFDVNKKCIRNGPAILTKPKKQRRAFSTFIATIILVGISVAGSAIILPLLTSSTDTINQNTACYLVNVKLYKITSAFQAYFIANLQNSGNIYVTDVSITFADDLNAKYGFYENSLTLLPGTSLVKNQTFAGTITKGNSYIVDANIIAEDGSKASCIQVVTAR